MQFLMFFHDFIEKMNLLEHKDCFLMFLMIFEKSGHPENFQADLRFLVFWDGVP